MISTEKIETLLKHPAIRAVRRYANEDSYFKRNFCFQALGVAFEIKWYANVSTLFHHGMEIRFTDMEIKSTWPNSFKTNIHLFNNGEIICIIPLETYK